MNWITILLLQHWSKINQFSHEEPTDIKNIFPIPQNARKLFSGIDFGMPDCAIFLVSSYGLISLLSVQK